MRINLTSLHECVSFWPDDEDSHNRRRNIFKSATGAVSPVEYTAGQQRLIIKNRYWDSKPFSYGDTKRLVDFLTTCMICEDNFLVTNPEVVEASTTMTASCRLPFAVLKRVSDNPRQNEPEEVEANILSHFQTFVLGHYYTLFMLLVDTSQLAVKEAFGSWGWA